MEVVGSLNQVLGGRVGLSPVMVGRSAAYAQLRSLMPTASVTVADLPTVALVAGEAGVGKTRLLRELVADLPSGITVLSGAADPDALGRPYSLAAAVLPGAAVRLHRPGRGRGPLRRAHRRRPGHRHLRGPALGRRRERDGHRPPRPAVLPSPPAHRHLPAGRPQPSPPRRRPAAPAGAPARGRAGPPGPPGPQRRGCAGRRHLLVAAVLGRHRGRLHPLRRQPVPDRGDRRRHRVPGGQPERPAGRPPPVVARGGRPQPARGADDAGAPGARGRRGLRADHAVRGPRPGRRHARGRPARGAAPAGRRQPPGRGRRRPLQLPPRARERRGRAPAARPRAPPAPRAGARGVALVRRRRPRGDGSPRGGRGPVRGVRDPLPGRGPALPGPGIHLPVAPARRRCAERGAGRSRPPRRGGRVGVAGVALRRGPRLHGPLAGDGPRARRHRGGGRRAPLAAPPAPRDAPARRDHRRAARCWRS